MRRRLVLSFVVRIVRRCRLTVVLVVVAIKVVAIKVFVIKVVVNLSTQHGKR